MLLNNEKLQQKNIKNLNGGQKLGEPKNVIQLDDIHFVTKRENLGEFHPQNV